MDFVLHSSDIMPDDIIPVRFTCEGQDLSPTLTWGSVPEGTKSFTLIMDDPDAPRGTFVHWVLYNLPGNVRGLPINVEKDPELSDGSRQGKNDFGKIGYGGPCPPPGHGPHRYFFTIYALDTTLDHLPPGLSKAEIIAAMTEHVIAQAQLVGRFERKTTRV